MIHALIVIAYTRKNPDPYTGFEVTGSSCVTIEEARAEVERDNDDDNNEKVVAYFPIDQTNLGLQAFAAVLSLAIEADHNVQGVALESLLTQLFMSGYMKGIHSVGAAYP